MNNHDAIRLQRLTEIADLKADQALASLAQATQETNKLLQSLTVIDAKVQDALANAADPGAQHLAMKFSEMMRQRRAEILAQLATAERLRRAKHKVARQEEGRRIALSRLSDQAS